MLEKLTTEARNPASEGIDSLSAMGIAKLILSEDEKITSAIASELEPIAQAIDVITERLAMGGRLVYLGAGTSGRLGVLDASECPPTFNTDSSLVIGLIAGGPSAILDAVEGAEDSIDMAIEDLAGIEFSEKDVLVGIAASGRTPYVLGALDYARSKGAFTIGISCNRDAALKTSADLSILPVVGPEVLSGSTRMKAGTATKMVLNMLSTGVMIRLGKTYGNLMVDLCATNEKLIQRSINIVLAVTGLSRTEAEESLSRCGGEVKTVIACAQLGISPDQARALLESVQGHLRRAIVLGSTELDGNELGRTGLESTAGGKK